MSISILCYFMTHYISEKNVVNFNFIQIINKNINKVIHYEYYGLKYQQYMKQFKLAPLLPPATLVML